MRRSARHLCSSSYTLLFDSHSCHSPFLPPRGDQGCSGLSCHDNWSLNDLCLVGIWANSHFSAWSSSVRRSSWPWSVFHNSLCWYFWKSWLEGSELWCSATGGKQFLFKGTLHQKVSFDVCWSFLFLSIRHKQHNFLYTEEAKTSWSWAKLSHSWA